jgi:hypothetical protein
MQSSLPSMWRCWHELFQKRDVLPCQPILAKVQMTLVWQRCQARRDLVGFIYSKLILPSRKRTGPRVLGVEECHSIQGSERKIKLYLPTLQNGHPPWRPDGLQNFKRNQSPWQGFRLANSLSSDGHAFCEEIRILSCWRPLTGEVALRGIRILRWKLWWERETNQLKKWWETIPLVKKMVGIIRWPNLDSIKYSS